MEQRVKKCLGLDITIINLHKVVCEYYRLINKSKLDKKLEVSLLLF